MAAKERLERPKVVPVRVKHHVPLCIHFGDDYQLQVR
jgi:hypothetical protein